MSRTTPLTSSPRCKRTVREHHDGETRLVVMTKSLGEQRARPGDAAGGTDAASNPRMQLSALRAAADTAR